MFKLIILGIPVSFIQTNGQNGFINSVIFLMFISSLVFTLLHFSLQLAVQSDHHLIVFSIWAALARASSSSLSLSSSLLSQSGPAPSPMTPKDPSPRPPSPGESSNGGLELGVSPVGLDALMRLSGEQTALSGPSPRLHNRPLPGDFPPSDRWGLGVGFILKAMKLFRTVKIQQIIIPDNQ